MAKIASTDFAFPVVFEVGLPSAVGTPSFEQVQPQTSINDKLGWIIHRAELFLPTEAYAAFWAATAPFTIEMGLSNSNAFTTPKADNPAIKVRMRSVFQIATAAAGTTSRIQDNQPLVQDFTTLPGGGLLMLPYPLFGYTFISGTLPAAVAGVNTYLKLLVSQVQLTDADFFAILQANQLLISS